jgi:transposase
MVEITTIGLDLAKSAFQLHGVDAAGGAVLRRQLRRGKLLSFFAALPPCLVGREACGSVASLCSASRGTGAQTATSAAG